MSASRVGWFSVTGPVMQLRPVLDLDAGLEPLVPASVRVPLAEMA